MQMTAICSSPHAFQFDLWSYYYMTISMFYMLWSLLLGDVWMGCSKKLTEQFEFSYRHTWNIFVINKWHHRWAFVHILQYSKPMVCYTQFKIGAHIKDKKKINILTLHNSIRTGIQSLLLISEKNKIKSITHWN